MAEKHKAQSLINERTFAKLSSLIAPSRNRTAISAPERQRVTLLHYGSYGGTKGDRTLDLLRAKQALLPAEL